MFALFLPMACAGTLLHELGHVAVARVLGYETELHYGSMSWWGAETERAPDAHAAWIALGGPAQTMLTGTLGCAWLWALRRAARAADWRVWAATPLALFWSREVFNGALALVGRERGELRWDEARLSAALGWPGWLLPLATALAGLVACALVVFVLHPRETRGVLVAAGGTGALAGYGLWYGLVGPALLP